MLPCTTRDLTIVAVPNDRHKTVFGNSIFGHELSVPTSWVESVEKDFFPFCFACMPASCVARFCCCCLLSSILMCSSCCVLASLLSHCLFRVTKDFRHGCLPSCCRPCHGLFGSSVTLVLCWPTTTSQSHASLWRGSGRCRLEALCD
jgi:hypothetical protein